MNLTQQEKQYMEQSGPCIRCGKLCKASYRDTGGQCSDCHNQAYFEHKKAQQLRNIANKEEGALFWSQKGIKVGDKVSILVPDLLGISVHRVYGITKIGVNGAYVVSHVQPGKLAPEGWEKGEIRQ